MTNHVIYLMWCLTRIAFGCSVSSSTLKCVLTLCPSQISLVTSSFGGRKTERLKFNFKLKWRCTAFLSQLMAILNQLGNGTANSRGLRWSCHSQCLLPLSLRFQELEGCHGYQQSFCRPPWHPTHKEKKHKATRYAATYHYLHVKSIALSFVFKHVKLNIEHFKVVGKIFPHENVMEWPDGTDRLCADIKFPFHLIIVESWLFILGESYERHIFSNEHVAALSSVYLDIL